MTDYMKLIRDKARRRKAVVVFPESGDQRVLEAVGIIAGEKIVEPLLVGNKKEIEKNLSQVSKDPSFLDGFRAGAEGSGLKQIVSGTVGGVVKPTQEAMGEGLMAGTT